MLSVLIVRDGGKWNPIMTISNCFHKGDFFINQTCLYWHKMASRLLLIKCAENVNVNCAVTEQVVGNCSDWKGEIHSSRTSSTQYPMNLLVAHLPPLVKKDEPWELQPYLKRNDKIKQYDVQGNAHTCTLMMLNGRTGSLLSEERCRCPKEYIPCWYIWEPHPSKTRSLWSRSLAVM